MKSFQLLTLRRKLILSCLGVALIPLFSLALLNQRLTRQALTENANQTLLAAASQTALSVDAFINTHLDAIRVEAQLPILSRYLSLPPQARTTLTSEVGAVLSALSRKDILNISSYALLDRQGRVVIDTDTPSIGEVRGDQDYFQEPLRTGLPYVSSVHISATSRVPSLYFSSPIRDASGQFIGVLRLRYNAVIIQRLINQNTGLVSGKGSFAILLDEYYIRLAQGDAPEQILTPIAPLPLETAEILESQGRLKPAWEADLWANLPGFKQGLDQMGRSPFFTVSLDPLSGDLKAAAVTRLESKPWLVVFVQSKSVFLAPIQTQIRITFWLVLAIAILVAIAAVLIGQLLAKPLMLLADTVAQFTAGNLQVRSAIRSQDEIGVLAFSFNKMAEQIGKLLQGLEDRTHELEVSQSVTAAVTELSRSILTPDRLLQDAIALMQRRFGLNYVQIYLVDWLTNRLVEHVESGKPLTPEEEQYSSIFFDNHDSLVARSARSHKLICAEPGTTQNRQGSEVAVPLIACGSLLGVMVIQDEESDDFSETDLETFKTLAGQIATALENARLFEEVQQAEIQYRAKAEELEQTLIKLKKAQTQLIQTEKMSSLGQLVAGIAHEINNPVNFIYGNITPATEYLGNLLELLNLYQQHYPKPAPDIRFFSEQIELDFVIEDFQRILESMKIGAERIRQIVSSLKNFSRLDESDMKAVNIHDGINNTLIILQHKLKDKPGHPEIKVIKDYANLPFVECYAGQLNQVFMNLIANAIDSIEASQEQAILSHQTIPVGEIKISTQILEEKDVEIRIRDNGLGMSLEVQKRLFDPFFTTKEVGKGTGLGLAISYQIIVDKHHGELYCLSNPGQGAEFVIRIPIIMNKSA